MPSRRHLPVLAGNPETTDDADARSDLSPAAWVGIGALATLVVGAVLAALFYVPFARETLRAVPRAPSAVALQALRLRLLCVAIPVVSAALAIGGAIVGRFGSAIRVRHGAYAGALALSIAVIAGGRAAFTRDGAGIWFVVPFGAAIAALGAWIAMRPSRARRSQ